MRILKIRNSFSSLPVFFVCLVAAPLLQAAPTLVTISSRTLIVSGSSFTVKGVNYSPTPIGYTNGNSGGGCVGPYRWWTDRPMYVADFPLIKKMGANAIRTFALMNSGGTEAQVRLALDEAYANGLYVIAGYFVPSSPNQTIVQNEVLAAVNQYKDHPAILMWMIGNEHNFTTDGNTSAWYNFLNTLAGLIKAQDPNHPVGTVEGEIVPGQSFNLGSVPHMANDANMTNLDIWGVNIYRGKTFQGLFQTLASRTTKPLLLAEFGKDAFRDSTQSEDQTMQSDYLSNQWAQIAANLSAADSTKPLVGAAVFEWVDEWWKDSGPCLGHDTSILFDRNSTDMDDPGYNDEWFGLAGIVPIDAVTNPAGTFRQFRSGYLTLCDAWNPGGCTVGTVSPDALGFFQGPVRNYPNPFVLGQGATQFVAVTNRPGEISIEIFDLSGQPVRALPPVQASVAGLEVTWNWDGRTDGGTLVSSGLYIARIRGGGEEQFRKVVGVK